MKSDHDIQIVDTIKNKIKSFLNNLVIFVKLQNNKFTNFSMKTTLLTISVINKPANYLLNDLVTVKCIQFGSGLKLKQKFIELRKMMKIKQK